MACIFMIVQKLFNGLSQCRNGLNQHGVGPTAIIAQSGFTVRLAEAQLTDLIGAGGRIGVDRPVQKSDLFENQQDAAQCDLRDRDMTNVCGRFDDSLAVRSQDNMFDRTGTGTATAFETDPRIGRDRFFFDSSVVGDNQSDAQAGAQKGIAQARRQFAPHEDWISRFHRQPPDAHRS